MGDIEKFSWPNLEGSIMKGLRREIERLSEENNCAIALSIAGYMAGIFEIASWVRGYQDFYLDLARNSPIAHSLLDKATDLKIAYWDTVLNEVGDLVQIAIEGDDLGTQNRTIISPNMYRKLIKPRHREIFNFIKQKAPHIHLFFHSDGSIYDLIPDLVEIGVDISNPVQYTAAKMDTRRLKREFGKEICFWGGGIDTQKILPHGTLQEIKDEVRRRIADLAPGVGFVFATVHNIQADVPPANIMAMWEALQEYGDY